MKLKTSNSMPAFLQRVSTLARANKPQIKVAPKLSNAAAQKIRAKANAIMGVK